MRFDRNLTALLGAAAVALCATTACSTGQFKDPSTDDNNELKADKPSGGAGGKASLHVPIIDEDLDLMSTMNDDMKSAGLDAFVDVVVFEEKADKWGGATDESAALWDKMSDLADEAQTKGLTSREMVRYAEPYDYVTENASTSICFTGNAEHAMSLVENLGDKVFSDQFLVHAWRHKDQIVYADWVDEMPEIIDEFPNEWKNWDEGRDEIILLSSVSDDGDEHNWNIIPRCAESDAARTDK